MATFRVDIPCIMDIHYCGTPFILLTILNDNQIVSLKKQFKKRLPLFEFIRNR